MLLSGILIICAFYAAFTIIEIYFARKVMARQALKEK